MTLDMYVVYENPLDFPGQFVVRRWTTPPPTPDHDATTVCHTLEEARAAIPPDRACIGRAGSDDPAIREVWV